MSDTCNATSSGRDSHSGPSNGPALIGTARSLDAGCRAAQLRLGPVQVLDPKHPSHSLLLCVGTDCRVTRTRCPTTCTIPAAIDHSLHLACRCSCQKRAFFSYLRVFPAVCPVLFCRIVDTIRLFTQHLHVLSSTPTSFRFYCVCRLLSLLILRPLSLVSCLSDSCISRIYLISTVLGREKAHVHQHLHHRSATPPRSFTPVREVRYCHCIAIIIIVNLPLSASAPAPRALSGLSSIPCGLPNMQAANGLVLGDLGQGEKQGKGEAIC